VEFTPYSWQYVRWLWRLTLCASTLHFNSSFHPHLGLSSSLFLAGLPTTTRPSLPLWAIARLILGERSQTSNCVYHATFFFLKGVLLVNVVRAIKIFSFPTYTFILFLTLERVTRVWILRTKQQRNPNKEIKCTWMFLAVPAAAVRHCNFRAGRY
jgi:hypothetical protein